MSYVPRDLDYDPSTACAAAHVLKFDHTEIDLVCDLAVGHDGDKHRKTLPGGVVVYWPKEKKE